MRPLLLTALVGLSACDYSGDFLFAGAVEGVPGVLVIPNADGERLHTPALVNNYEAIQENTIYFELGPTGTAELGGATFEFVGTGGSVCVWVDPETAFWSQAIELNLTPYARQFAYPDNFYDDGDIDLTGGRSVFYTGSPGSRMGDFVLNYEDELGNDVPISFIECEPKIGNSDFSDNAHAGRGAPENCTISSTELGVTYTIALQTWSTPLDDDRVGVGLLLASGRCDDLLGLAQGEHDPTPLSVDAQNAECVITGESLRPEDPGPHYGYAAIDGLTWDGSEDFEKAFCGSRTQPRLDAFCEAEAAGLRGLSDEEVDALSSDELRDLSDEHLCEWSEPTDDSNRCYCGNIDDTPQQGAG